MPNVNQPCPGRCNAAWRAAEIHREATGEPHQLAPVTGEPAWCERCTQRLRFTLLDLPHLAALLLIEAERGTPRPGATKVSGSRERALHPGEAAYRAIEEIHGVLTGWEDKVRYWRGLSPRPDGVRHGVAITDGARFLDTHLDWLLAHCPDEDRPIEMDEELALLRRRLYVVCHLDEPRPQPRDGVPCWNCDLMALVHELDEQGRATGYTRCRACGESRHESDMQQWIALVAAANTPSAAPVAA